MQYWHDSSYKYYRRYLNGDISYEKQAEKTILDMFAYLEEDLSYIDILELLRSYINLRFDEWTLFDDVRETLEKLI